MDYPTISFGTYRLKDKELKSSLEHALLNGYKSIDTARLYKNENIIGQFITENEIPRDSLWITSKLDPKIMSKSEDDILHSISLTLYDLNTKYLDLFLIHTPMDDHIIKCWSILEQFKLQGIFKNIGVSNFNIDQIEKIKNFSTTPIFTNQIELSPFLTRNDLVTYMNKQNILISAHSSLTKGEKLLDPILNDIAKKYNKTSAQIMLKWSIQKKYHIMPRSKNENHIKENFDLNFIISDDDMIILDSLNCNYYTHPKYK